MCGAALDWEPAECGQRGRGIVSNPWVTSILPTVTCEGRRVGGMTAAGGGGGGQGELFKYSNSRSSSPRTSMPPRVARVRFPRRAREYSHTLISNSLFAGLYFVRLHPTFSLINNDVDSFKFI